MEKTPLIEKEKLDNIRFAEGDALSAPEEIKQRREDIEKAMRFGNNDKGKISIVFLSTEGPRKVETTVWSVTENKVILKSGVFIPIRCIQQINLYPAP